jgi:hypothetical protein
LTGSLRITEPTESPDQNAAGLPQSSPDPLRYDKQEGIMDATHLRWFTQESIKALLASSGFGVIQYRATAGQWLSDNWGRAPLRWLPSAARVRFLRTASRRWPTLFGSQHVVKAVMQ